MATDGNQGTITGVRDDNASSTGGETVTPTPPGLLPKRKATHTSVAIPVSLPQTPEGPAEAVRNEIPLAHQEEGEPTSPSRRRLTNLEETRAEQHAAAPTPAEPNRLLQNILDHLGRQDARTDARFASLAAAKAFSMDEINRLKTSRSANAVYAPELPGRPQAAQPVQTMGITNPRDTEIAELRRAVVEMSSKIHRATSSAPELDRVLEETQQTAFTRRITSVSVRGSKKIKLERYNGKGDPKEFL
ncbi:unnamed protein product [Arabidopsis lyrata]|nr:unnamed protein product [Arabidopsis lyrata]